MPNELNRVSEQTACPDCLHARLNGRAIFADCEECMYARYYEIFAVLSCDYCLYASRWGVRGLDLDSATEERILAGLSKWGIASFCVEYGTFPFFSDAPCELCGDRIGGDRHRMLVQYRG